MRPRTGKSAMTIAGVLALMFIIFGVLYAQESGKRSSYSPVVITRTSLPLWLE